MISFAYTTYPILLMCQAKEKQPLSANKEAKLEASGAQKKGERKKSRENKHETLLGWHCFYVAMFLRRLPNAFGFYSLSKY